MQVTVDMHISLPKPKAIKGEPIRRSISAVTPCVQKRSCLFTVMLLLFSIVKESRYVERKNTINPMSLSRVSDNKREGLWKCTVRFHPLRSFWRADLRSYLHCKGLYAEKIVHFYSCLLHLATVKESGYDENG
ncbi:hypothetical protein AUEXF2481DRAFT_667611 [Aureobasidium subglaciale EXF-2481]|uniref:Uncharacterized protein n=1 Tax=Aureobasidium subglaciale (strain EXF-2481) TaxID=1043005 RepID=A0A074YEP2_AURSE|nr:uncharacterized protein AUEXF2481DRAFT_667611 [Aureobasidium subglaciale EXF-2481]KEQ96195.1 hypothetical protein AUEXF2481DRAFT_667611 [Aureobasidium subglaciale EXF-2481]